MYIINNVVLRTVSIGEWNNIKHWVERNLTHGDNFLWKQYTRKGYSLLNGTDIVEGNENFYIRIK